MRDFTLNKYSVLLTMLRNSGFGIFPIIDFVCAQQNRSVAIRHDVDKNIDQSLKMAQLEADEDIYTTYFFRKHDIFCHSEKIRLISQLGHEIGYHYENLSHCNGDRDAAFLDFKRTLQQLQQIAWVSGLAMHGSPLSAHNNRALWNHFSFFDLGPGYEVYSHINYTHVLYLTDTGRCWDGHNFSIRDKVSSTSLDAVQTCNFHNTHQIIRAAASGLLPNKLLLNIHPQRWHNAPLPWLTELIMQNLKNQIKRMIVHFS